jgi:hypothetical protein
MYISSFDERRRIEIAALSAGDEDWKSRSGLVSIMHGRKPTCACAQH